MRIKLSYYFVSEPLLRQTPAGRGVWNGHTFHANDPDAKVCDAWVVLDDPHSPETIRLETGHAILLTMEPPGLREYPSSYLAQFDLVISSHTDLDHPSVRNEYQGFPWHAGLRKHAGGAARGTDAINFDYDDFSMARMPQKDELLSVICSTDTRLLGHRARIDFVEKLSARLGNRMEVFGRGIRPVADKLDAILPYRYHISLENSRVPHYWTDKLSDAFLGWAYPIYWGCPNISDYFPPHSLATIDIERDDAVELVESLIERELTPEQAEGLARGRDLVLNRYNLFDVIARACASLPAREAREITIRPLDDFRPPKRRFFGTVKGKKW